MKHCPHTRSGLVIYFPGEYDSYCCFCGEVRKTSYTAVVRPGHGVHLQKGQETDLIPDAPWEDDCPAVRMEVRQNGEWRDYYLTP